ncbi:hypothetical protein Tco_1474100 [Tanacetum coccineum]
MSSLQPCAGICRSGGVPDGGVSALVWESMICGSGNGRGAKGSASDTRSGEDTGSGDSIRGSGGEGI